MGFVILNLREKAEERMQVAGVCPASPEHRCLLVSVVSLMFEAFSMPLRAEHFVVFMVIKSL